MIAAVFDTNVVVSGILTPGGPPGRILDAILDGVCRPVLTDGILAEYEEVLCRPKFRFSTDDVQLLLDAIRACALVAPYTPFPLKTPLPYPDDIIFLEAAAALGAPLVTGNVRHFPRSAIGRVSVLTPASFLNTLANQ
ncbi:MAG: PIN domain-containing protein [Kiritimatiellae bacterium]|nr:PIN domain-containing protein [Kiritimatiellia bacterium]